MAHGDITHVEIPVRDTAAASGFYSALFGWEIAEMEGFEGYPMWRAPNGVSGGGLTARDEVVQQPLAYVEVDAIDDVLAKAVELGGTIAVPRTAFDETSWSAVVKDADGNLLGLFEGNVGG